MKAIFFIISSLLFCNILSFKYEEITMNKVYNLENKEEKLSYFKFPLSNLETIPSEIKIETTDLKSDSSSNGVIGVHYEPFKIKKYENILKSELGKPITLDSEFIKSALEKNKQIYLTVFCKKCHYKINILPNGDMKSVKNFVQIPRIRNLVEETQYNNTETRMNFYGADGVSALMVAFIMIFVSIIGCIIMMNIYVHNTALVEQPLKLGRIEA